jgi:hypothetical protein
MLKKLRKRIKGQSTAEYAILIALVIAAVIAMQRFAQRALQGRIYDASKYMVNQTSAMGNTVQYEPYYLQTNFDVTRRQQQVQRLDTNLVSANALSNITRGTGGYQQFQYNGSGTLQNGMTL